MILHLVLKSNKKMAVTYFITKFVTAMNTCSVILRNYLLAPPKSVFLASKKRAIARMKRMLPSAAVMM